MRYGTPPVVRATGGLADTVIDADAEPVAGTGFVFGPAEPDALADAVSRALAAWADRPRFARIVARGMARDDSWRMPARAYEAAYRRAQALAQVSGSAISTASMTACPGARANLQRVRPRFRFAW